MKSIEIKGSLRTETGKKATRELRKDNGIPCVLYGTQKDENGNQVATHLQFLLKACVTWYTHRTSTL